MSKDADRTWVDVKDVCGAYGYVYTTAKNKILEGTFPVPTFKQGRKHAIDIEVHIAYFAKKRAEALAQMNAFTS